MPVELGKALYFPYIELWNRVEWLKTAALYHDKICRIVPQSYTTWDPDEIKALIDIGFIENRSPKRAAEGLVDEFYVFASDHILDPEKRAHLAAELRVSHQWGQIHIDKIDRALVKALSSAALLRETESEWLEVEPVTALMYMTFLAKKLAGSLPLISDDPAYQKLAYGTYSLSSRDGGASGDLGYRIASASIKTWVPVDLRNVPMSAIVDIRREFAGERVRFYEAVGTLGQDLLKVTDENDLEDAIAHRQASIGESLEALRLKLDSHRLAVRTGLFGISVPAIARSGGLTDPVVLAGIGAISAGCVVWKYFRDVRSSRLENSWSYLMTLTDELKDFNATQHFTGLGIDGPHLAKRPTPSKIKGFKTRWRRMRRSM